MGCSVGFKYAKNALAAGASPWAPLGNSQRSHRPLTQGRAEGGQGPFPPNHGQKKLKLSCRVTHIDAHIDVLAVAVINDHKQLINRGIDMGQGEHVPNIYEGETYMVMSPNILEVMSFTLGVFYSVTATTVVCCILMQIFV